MDATTTPASNFSWSNTFDKLLTAGASIYSGVTNASLAKSNAKAAAAAQQAAAANAQTQQSSIVKYALIAVGVVVAIGLVVFLIKKK